MAFFCFFRGAIKLLACTPLLLGWQAEISNPTRQYGQGVFQSKGAGEEKSKSPTQAAVMMPEICNDGAAWLSWTGTVWIRQRGISNTVRVISASSNGY